MNDHIKKGPDRTTNGISYALKSINAVSYTAHDHGSYTIPKL
jgi:hypothetical protein